MFVFFFNDTATTEIYTLSLHDALRSIAEMLRNVLKHTFCKKLNSALGDFVLLTGR